MEKFLILFLVAACISIEVSASSILHPVDIEQECIDATAVITEKLSCLQGIKWKEVEAPKKEGYRVFEIMITQPIDHFYSTPEEFQQRLMLSHKSETLPVVLFTSGYRIFSDDFDNLTILLGANELVRAERFFEGAEPQNFDWTKLNSEQSAYDAHAITLKFKKIYKTNWIGTGGSKGGVCSLVHHMYFPNDLAGVVADVAPLAKSDRDPRYIEFLKTVGGEKYKACRAALNQFQILALKNREELSKNMVGNFSILGKDAAFDHAVIESVFYTWQYVSPEEFCSQVPNENSTIEEIWKFLDSVNSPNYYTDEALKVWMPYAYQTMTELGYADYETHHFQDLLKVKFDFRKTAPQNISLHFSNEFWQNAENWAKIYADRIIYIYGEFDPWSSTPFPMPLEKKDVVSFVMIGASHITADIINLTAEQAAVAYPLLEKWTGTKIKLNLSHEKSKKEYKRHLSKRDRKTLQ